jgi:hypothetical protein
MHFYVLTYHAHGTTDQNHHPKLIGDINGQILIGFYHFIQPAGIEI